MKKDSYLMFITSLEELADVGKCAEDLNMKLESVLAYHSVHGDVLIVFKNGSPRRKLSRNWS